MKITRSGFFLVLFGAVLVCFVAFLNRFPVVYSDTGTYIDTGFNSKVAWDRPIFYGLFIRHLSLATSLWYVILAQGLLVSYTVFKTFDMFYKGTKRNFLFISSLVLLTLFTGISYNTSILLADIFSPICILCFANLLLNDKLSKIEKGILYIIFIYSMLVHFSNFFVLFSLAFLILIYAIIKRLKKQPITLKGNRMIGLFIAILSVLLITPSVNYAFSKQFSFSKGSPVFIINHLLETGVLEEYLNDECAHKNYKLCQYKDQLGWDFIWRNDSPFYKMGGADSTKNDYNKIIVDILTTPKYCKEVVLQSFEFSIIQFFTFDIPANGNEGNGSAPLSAVSQNFNQYYRAYASSMQSVNALDSNLRTTNQIQRILVLLSLALLICIIFVPTFFNLLPPQLKWLSVIILVFSYLNAGICSNLSTIIDRYQDRIAWLIPLTAIILTEHFISPYLQVLKKKIGMLKE